MVILLLLSSAYRREAWVLLLNASLMTLSLLFLIVILRDTGVQSRWLNVDLPLGYGLLALIVCLTCSAVGKMRQPVLTASIAFPVVGGVVCLGVVQALAELSSWHSLAQGSIVFIPLLCMIMTMQLATRLSRVEPIKPRRVQVPLSSNDLRKAGCDNARARLVALMDQHAAFRQHDLQLSDLARQTGLSEDTIRATIKSCLAKNFFDYINGLRIAHAQTLLRDTDLSVTDVMFESGFRSKSSFNTEFRKRTGQTPSEFRRPL